MIKLTNLITELNINNTRITPEIVMDFIISIPKGDNFDKYYNTAEPIYNKYGWKGKISSLSGWLENLNTRDLGLLYIDLKKAFPDNINESQQITTQSILDYWDTKMQSRPKVDWNKFNQIKTKYFGKDKYVGLMDLEDNLDNHPLQPEQLSNLYSDLQQLFPKINVVTGSTLDELGINNYKVNRSEVLKYWIVYVKLSNHEYHKLRDEYSQKYLGHKVFKGTDLIQDLPLPALTKFYYELKKIFGEPINELNISNVNKSVEDIYDLYLNNFMKNDNHFKASFIFRKYGRDLHDDLNFKNWLKILDQSDLNEIYKELKALLKNE